jgi:hypothetical protein
MENLSRVVLFAILFVHLDANDLQPKQVLIVNALIGVIGLFLYRRHISIKLRKQNVAVSVSADSIVCFSAGKLQNALDLSSIWFVGLACRLHTDQDDQHRYDLCNEHVDDAHSSDVLRLWCRNSNVKNCLC